MRLIPLLRYATGLILLISVFESYATTSTAWYKVDKIRQVLKLVDVKCIDDKVEKCPRTRYWRVYYKATSPHAPLQSFTKELIEDIPQLGAIMQMTVDLSQHKKAAMKQP